MGEVYRAIDTRLHRPVALKIVRTDADAAEAVSEAGGVARLLREARAAAALNHANSVAIYELGEYEGTSYIAMEFVTGVPLRRYVGDVGVSVETKVSWLVDAARALWAAHKAGLVHRDVKPGNIMVSDEGVVKVLDFGLAKPAHVSPDPSAFQTKLGQMLGTPRYMAPEQLEGHPADARADQFAFGVTAYEVISGVFPGGALASSVPSLDTVAAGVSPELAGIIGRMMSRLPTDRYATMEEAAHALRSCAPSLRSLQGASQGGAAARRARAAGSSDAPTAVTRPADVSTKGATLPLTGSVTAPSGPATPAGASFAGPPDRGAMSRTLPMGGPTSPPSMRSVTRPVSIAEAPLPAHVPTSPWPVVVVFAVFAITAGGAAAYLLR